MDFEEIGARLSNLTMYDVKQLYTTAKNYALNISEIEAKVREATNDDPWGASSSVMQEIASATHNFQDFNEIMPTIYSRFMEKEAREWRQIYKALQLLEYIVKHGSERVVDDARSHVSTIKILRNFHYIDEQGKDQGINVRNRAKELSELLSDVDRIRMERRKARTNKNKYQGGGNGDFVPGSGGGRYGGFGSDSAFAQGSGSGGGGYGGDRAPRRDASFDQYDAGDYEETGRSGGSSSAAPSRGAAAPPPKKEEKVVDLFSFDDDEPAPPAPAPKVAAPAQAAAPIDAFGDDFDDFQSAPTPAAAPAPSRAPAAVVPKPAVTAPSGGANVFDFLDSAPSAAAAPAIAPTRTYSASSSQPLSPSQPLSAAKSPSIAASTTSSASSGTKGLSGFDDLWSTSATAVGAQPKGGANGKGKMTMAEMARNQSQNAVWGSGAGAGQPAQQKKDVFDFL